jgi:hypothetical protein
MTDENQAFTHLRRLFAKIGVNECDGDFSKDAMATRTHSNSHLAKMT